MGPVWSFSIPPKTAYAPDPADGGDSVDLDVQLSWTPGFGAKLHTVYFGDNFDDVNNATGGQAQGTATYTPGPLQLSKTYYWRVDEFDIVETHKGDVWSSTTVGAVGSPEPANGAVDVTQTPVAPSARGPAYKPTQWISLYDSVVSILTLQACFDSFFITKALLYAGRSGKFPDGQKSDFLSIKEVQVDFCRFGII